MKLKNALLLAYYYPPFGQTSSRRSGCMAKYLREFGYNPIVYTRDWNEDNGPYDPSFVSNIPDDIEVFRSNVPNSPRGLAGKLGWRLKRTVRPDNDVAVRSKNSRQEVVDLARKHDVQIIWSTFPPLSYLSLADEVSRETGIPWVADFRDVEQFIDGVGAALMYPARIHHMKKALRSASEYVAVSNGFIETLRKRTGHQGKVIHNGFDPEIVAEPQEREFPLFEIVYTGGISLGRPDFTPLLDALGILCEDSRVDPSTVRVSFYGGSNAKRLAEFSSHPMYKLVKDHGGVPRSESLEKQRSALILLQTTAPGTGWLTSKIYEYHVACRPILAFPRDGDHIEELLNETGAGVARTSPTEIAAQLLEWHAEWKSTGSVKWRGDMDVVWQYSRKSQAENTALIFDEILGNAQ